jgi:YVTN family beta-propeller protein
MLNRRALVVPAILLALLSFSCTTDTTSASGAVPATIAVAPDSVTLPMLGSQQLVVTVFDGSGHLIIGVAVAFSSSDTTRVKVSAAGVVQAVGPVGTATVTVSSPPANTTVPIVVVQRGAASVSASPNSLGLLPGDSAQLTITVRDSSNAIITGAPVTFTTNAPSIATVSAAGMVRAVGFGSAVITATSGPASTFVAVAVQPPDALADRIAIPGPMYGIDVSSGGVVYATANAGNAMARLSLAPPAMTGSVLVGYGPTGVAFSPNGATAYVTNQLSRTLGVVDVASDVQVDTVPVNADPFVTAVSPDGSTVIVTGNSDSIFVVNAASRTVVASLAVGSAPNGLAFNAAGTRLYVSNALDGSVMEVNPVTPAVLRTFTTGGRPQGLALSADGTELYIANEFGWLETRNIASGARVDSIPLDGGGFAVARSPDNAVLYVGIPSIGRVQIFQRATRQVIKRLATGGTPRRIAFTSDSRHAVIANEWGWVDVVNR